MKILFTSDLHGNLKAIEEFSMKLSKYDCGIISGDIGDDGVPDNEIKEFIDSGDLDEDDSIPELQDADLSFGENMSNQIKRIYDDDSFYKKSLDLKENKIREILSRANKPIFIVPGNHDRTEWKSDSLLHNVHNRCMDFQGFNFVGYRWTDLRRSLSDQKKDIEKLYPLVSNNTILITHNPPYGILDGVGDKDEIHMGSKDLLELTRQKHPRLHLFGHCHIGFGQFDNYYNGSYPRSKRFMSISF